MASAVDPAAFPRSSRANRCLPSPWSNVVRGEHDYSAASPSAPSAVLIPSGDPSGRSPENLCVETLPPLSSESSDHAGDGNATAVAILSTGKKHAWNTPSNVSNEGGAVMDAADWPALSDSARASPKSSDSLKALSDGSSSTNMGSLSSSSKPASSNANPNLASNTPSSSRHKTVKRGAVIGGSSGNGAANSGLSTPSQLPVSRQASQLVLDKQSTSENSPKGLPNRSINHNNFNWDNGTKAIGVSQQPHGGNDHQRGYSSGRRGNNGHHNSYGNRRDPDRGGFEWNHRNFGRDVRMQQMHQQWAFGPYVRPGSMTSQFVAPPLPPRHFSNMGFPYFSPSFYYLPATPNPDPLRGFPSGPPSAPPPPVMFWPAPDPLRDVLLNQIDYYFSPENLCRDRYLRQKMDEQGWVPIYVVAEFNRVRNLTTNIPYILDTMRLSSVVEIQGDKIRKRNDWRTWLLPSSTNSGVNPNPQTERATSFDDLTEKFNDVELNNSFNQANTGSLIRNVAALASPSSGNFNSQL